ncbi:hypothetical protein JCM18909_4091 [Cutibacterium acnes JCM 18909]|nr:hypothetical protein JCM18909_4091 [Cutibacterium acnes JCM 18909]
MTATIDVGIPLRNADGYPDPTCYQALKEIQLAEYGYRPLVYICSPYSGDIAANVELARRFCAFAVKARQIPLAPHLHYPQFMDDTDRMPGSWRCFFQPHPAVEMRAAVGLYRRVSPGMRAEIDWAHQMDIPIRFFDADFQEVHPA